MSFSSLSPEGLFFQAGPVGRAVMITLAAASVWCWALIVEGVIAVGCLRRELAAAEINESRSRIRKIVEAGEGAALLPIVGETVGERRVRIEEAMSRTGSRLIGQAGRGLPNLAIISSVSPFIGLFGTVWGIMASFSAIAEMKDTSLAVVAPGIAEALAATAIGLGAAIPAAIAYNRIGASLAQMGQRLAHWIEAEAIQILKRNSSVD